MSEVAARVIFSLCSATAVACAWLLLRSSVRTRARMLFWSGLCFVGLAVSNILLVMDRVVFPASDLSTARAVSAAVGMMLLLYGLIWETE